jgi:cell division protein FtsW
MTPRRGREIWLLLLGAVLLGLGYWIVWQAYLPVWRLTGTPTFLHFLLPHLLLTAAWLALSVVLTLRRCRETLLLPIAALLIGVGLLFLHRLAGGVATQVVNQGYDLLQLNDLVKVKPHPALLDLARTMLLSVRKQFISILVAWGVMLGTALFWKDLSALRRYKYLVAATAVGLLLITTLFGREVNGQQLTLNLKFVAFQPHDLVKLLLVIFLAAYLVEKKELLAFARGKWGFLTLMDMRYMGPLITLWLLVLVIIFKHDDLGAALLLFGALLGMLYLGTERKVYVIIGLALFVAGGLGAMTLSARVHNRVAIWLHPESDPDNKGFQIVRGLLALADGRLVGTGLANGAPERIPAIHTDFIYVGISEELGLVGAVAVVGLFLCLLGRIAVVALQAHDRFAQLLAAGLGMTLAVQTWIILAGVTKLIPLTGITLPFVSYGGTSIVVNAFLLALVLKVAEEPPKALPPAV